jgi:hypothetical protein
MSIRVVVAAGCLASGMLSAAAIPLRAQAPELISACVKTSGQVRIVAATEVCNAGEQRLTWPATAPSLGALRVVDANGALIGRYGDLGNTVIPVGTDWISVLLSVDGPRTFSSGPTFYFSTPCPNPDDRTVVHGTPGHLGFAARELVKFAMPMPAAPSVVYYAGAEDPAFVPLSFEYDESTVNGSQRVCIAQPQPSGIVQKYAPAVAFNLGVFSPPYRVVQ